MTDLDELRRLEQPATPGPWAGVGDRYVSQAPPETSWPGSIWHETEDDVLSVLVDGDINEANVQLIVAMRNAFPALLDVAEAYGTLESLATDALTQVDSLEQGEPWWRRLNEFLSGPSALAKLNGEP